MDKNKSSIYFQTTIDCAHCHLKNGLQVIVSTINGEDKLSNYARMNFNSGCCDGVTQLVCHLDYGVKQVVEGRGQCSFSFRCPECTKDLKMTTLSFEEKGQGVRYGKTYLLSPCCQAKLRVQFIIEHEA